MKALFPGAAFFRLLLVATTGVVLIAALTPVAHYVPAAHVWDKANHLLAFASLAILCKLAFPAMLVRNLALLLLGLGVAIETLQAIPAINRSPEFADVLADIAGIAAGFALFCTVRLLAAWARRNGRRPLAPVPPYIRRT